MRESRRRLLMAFVGFAGALAAGPAVSGLQAQARQSPRAKPYPNGRETQTLVRSKTLPGP
jgi:hypothetical protein